MAWGLEPAPWASVPRIFVVSTSTLSSSFGM